MPTSEPGVGIGTGYFRPEYVIHGQQLNFPRELSLLARNIRLHYRTFNKATVSMTFRLHILNTCHVL